MDKKFLKTSFHLSDRTIFDYRKEFQNEKIIKILMEELNQSIIQRLKWAGYIVDNEEKADTIVE
jgi:hypothetical protein